MWFARAIDRDTFDGHAEAAADRLAPEPLDDEWQTALDNSIAQAKALKEEA